VDLQLAGGSKIKLVIYGLSAMYICKVILRFEVGTENSYAKISKLWRPPKSNRKTQYSRESAMAQMFGSSARAALRD
jgi:hypothetical protein